MQTTLSSRPAYPLYNTYSGSHLVRENPPIESAPADPLETPSIDSRGRVPDYGSLIPNPAKYPAPSTLSASDPMKTTWGFGNAENLYNDAIKNAVEGSWKHSQDYPLDPVTFKALIAAESAFRKDAVSPTGAVGLVQITEGTAKDYGLRISPPPDERTLPEKALPAGVQILADKLSVIKNPSTSLDYSKRVAAFYDEVGMPDTEQMETLALAGYNGGGSTVLRAMDYAIAEGRDPREYSSLVAEDLELTERPLYKAIRDTFGERFAEGKFKEMAAYPGRIREIRERAYRPLDGQRIMIDPGHGGSDPGAQGPTGAREADVTLDVGLRLRDQLESLGAEVRMTRVTDDNVSRPGGSQQEELAARVALANAWPAQVYVSVHANSADNPTAHGTETYHARTSSQASKVMAANVQKEMVAATGFRDRGVKQADFYVIKNTHMPAVLVETGFISNAVEEGHLVDPEMQDKMALAISNGVEQTFGVNPNWMEGSYADTGHLCYP